MKRLAAALGLAAAAVAFYPARPAVLSGLDVLRDMRGEPLRGKRLGLITNHTGKTVDGIAAAELLRGELGLDLRALFSPEHGFSGREAAGRRLRSGVEPSTGLPHYSLYGETRKPTPEMLRSLDALVFDIQDIGVRFYTYISTLKLAMDAAAEAGLEVIVLDRPNPLTGERIEGPVLDPRFLSFNGVAPIPLLHGMTVGELAQFFSGEGLIEGGRKARLEVIPARGWRRHMWWEETGQPWTPTSPNIRTLEAAVAYPALGLFEGINVSEGRGTRETFLIAGAPWIEMEKLVAALQAIPLSGLRFLPEEFTPEPLPEAPHPIYPGQRCFGFRLRVEERDRFEAVRAGLSAIATLRRLYPREFRWVEANGSFTIDRLLGTDAPRLRLEAGEKVEAVVASFEPDVARFRARRTRYLLYR